MRKCFPRSSVGIVAFSVLALGCTNRNASTLGTRVESTDSSASTVTGSNLRSVRSFGAVGDGVKDDYEALKRAAEYASANPGTTLFYPAGTYLIDQVQDVKQPSKAITFKNCRNIELKGEPGTVIVVKGSFHRMAVVEYEAGKFTGDKTQVTPFFFENCNGLVMSGFELDGNVDQMTRDAGVTEHSGGHGIVTRNCQNYRLENIEVHHFSTDGFYIGAGRTQTDKNGLLKNVISHHNARQGISILAASNLRIENSEFSNSGRTGKYGGHSPRAGVDIEPIFQVKKLNADGQTVGTMDEPTHNVVFEGCRLENNLGSQFVTVTAEIAKQITVRKSVIRAATDSSKYAVIAAIPEMNLEFSTIETEMGAIYPSFGVSDPETRVSTRIWANRISTKGSGIISRGKGGLVIEGNTITGVGAANNTGYIPYLGHEGAIFSRNAIFLPKEYFKSDQVSQSVSLVQRAALVSRNVYKTDLDPTKTFNVAYDLTKQCSREDFEDQIQPIGFSMEDCRP